MGEEIAFGNNKMKNFGLFFVFFASISHGQEISESPLRMVGTNIFDFTPIIYLLQHGEITNSSFLISGRISEIHSNEVKIVHNVLRNQLTEEFNKQMLLADPGQQLKILYASQLLDKWHQGQLSAGEIMSLDSGTRQIIFNEIEREKRDFIEVGVYVKNVPPVFLVLGKEVNILALPTGASRFDYGSAVAGSANDFTNRFLVTVSGFIKPKISKSIDSTKSNVLVSTNQ